MKFVFVAAILVPLTAAAQEKPAPQVLTVEQAIRVSNGLSQLDCFQPMEGQQGCKKQFEISLATRLVIARDIERGTAVFQSYQKEREKRRKALIMNEKGDIDRIAEQRFNVEDREALEASSGVTMERIKKDEILKESTPVPANVLALILPILD